MPEKLKKELGLLDVFSIASGAMISSGLFILPGLAYVQAGPSMILSYILAGLLAMTGMLSQSELISAMPKAGGDYFYITRSMGPAAGTVNGLIVWFSVSLKSAFALIGMAAFTKIIIDLDIRLIAILLSIVFLIINIYGAKVSGRFQTFLVVVLIGLLIFYIIDGLVHVDVQNLTPFSPKGVNSIFATAGLVFVSYGGLLKIASISEETKNPTRNIPLGMIFSLLIVTLLYGLVVFVTVGVLGNDLGTDITNASVTPITDGAKVFMGEYGVIALSLAAVLAFVSTANAGVMAASRYPMALSRDDLLPAIFGKLSKRSGTPFVSILVTGIFMIIAIMLDLDILIKAASTVIIFTYIMSCLSVLILRESRIQNYQPRFRSPFYPWIQIIGITGFIFLVFEMGMTSIIISLMLGFTGFLIYWFYGKKNVEKEYAILHLIERITNKKFLTGLLEKELKEIIRERDDIVQDRFDSIIEKCRILDIDEHLDTGSLFNIISYELSKELDIQASDIFRLLDEREKENSTALNDFIAIPHIIIEGSGHFNLLLIRAKNGITISENAQNIRAVFVLMGTKDERNFHLKAISAIAQLVRDPEFEKKWMKAKDEQNLRDTVLLGKRIRH